MPLRYYKSNSLSGEHKAAAVRNLSLGRELRLGMSGMRLGASAKILFSVRVLLAILIAAVAGGVGSAFFGHWGAMATWPFGLLLVLWAIRGKVGTGDRPPGGG